MVRVARAGDGAVISTPFVSVALVDMQQAAEVGHKLLDLAGEAPDGPREPHCECGALPSPRWLAEGWGDPS